MSELQSTMIRLLSAPVMHLDPTRDNERNLTQHFIVEAVNAEKQLWKVIQSKGLLHTDGQELYRKARCNYEELMLNNLELAEVQDIEYSLWKLHYKHIDEYRNRIRHSSLSKERLKLTAVQDVTTMQHEYENHLKGFKSFLSEATDFYHSLIRKIRRSYGISEELWFLNEDGSSSSIDPVKTNRCQFLSHRCLVCLGDLARYREVHGNPNDEYHSWSVAATHYLNASRIWPYSGNPHNQLAVLAIYVGDELLALYHCIRSLAVKEPFPDAWDNLILLFEKNRSSHLSSLSKEVPFDFIKPYKRSTVQISAQPSDAKATGDGLTNQTELWSLIVRLISYFYIKPSSEDFPCIFGSTIRELEALLSMDDAKLKITFESYQHMEVARTGPFRVLQLVSLLIFTIHALSESSILQKAKHVEYMKQPSLIQKALTTTFISMGRLINRCMIYDTVDSSPILPAILVFVEWLVNMLDKAEIYATDEKCASAMVYFFSAYADLLNHFDDERSEIDSSDYSILWEDDELRGFSPISPCDGPLDLRICQETRNSFEEKNERRVRICRIFVAAKKIVSGQKWIFYEETTRKFSTMRLEERPERREAVAVAVAVEADLGLNVRELQQKSLVPDDDQSHQEAGGACEVPESKVDEKQVNVHGNSPVEEEEVILFNPTTRHNPASLHLLPSTRSSKSLWQETIPEDSVVDSFSESPDSPRFKALSADSDEVTTQAGPPSLSAWVVNPNNNWIAEEKGLKEGEGTKQGSRSTEDSPSSCLSGLSIGGNEVSQQNINLKSSASGSHFPCGSTYVGDPVNAQRYLYFNIHHKVPPYMPPMPSAPLLPDNATWFTGNSSNYAENGTLEHGTRFFPVGAQVSSYPPYRGTQDTPNFNPIIPTFIERYAPYTSQTSSPQWPQERYTPYASQTSSPQWPQQYQVSFDQTHEHVLPVHFYTPATLGRYQDFDVSREPLYDQRINPSSFVPVNRMENPHYYSGFISGADEQRRETIFPAFTDPGPYGGTKDLRSEQLLLLKYLKEKEWYLQQEARLRGSV